MFLFCLLELKLDFCATYFESCSPNSPKDWRKQRLNTGNQLRQEQNSRQHHQAKTIYQHADERTNARNASPWLRRRHIDLWFRSSEHDVSILQSTDQVASWMQSNRRRKFCVYARFPGNCCECPNTVERSPKIKTVYQLPLNVR